MKFNLPAFLAFVIASESVAENAQESVVEPHIEPEIRVLKPCAEAQTLVGGNNTSDEPLGILRTKILYKKTRRANLTKSKLAMADAFVDTAHALLRERKLKPLERQIQYDCLRWEIELIRLRTLGCRDYSFALPAIAKALDIPYKPVARQTFDCQARKGTGFKRQVTKK